MDTNFIEHVEFHQTAQTLYIVGFLGDKCRMLQISRSGALEVKTVGERTVEECNRELLRVHDEAAHADGLQQLCKVCAGPLVRFQHCLSCAPPRAVHSRTLDALNEPRKQKRLQCQEQPSDLSWQLAKCTSTQDSMPLQAYGILGCFRFLEGYYLLLLTEREYIGSICGTQLFLAATVCYSGVQGPPTGCTRFNHQIIKTSCIRSC